jgi:serine/threonine protein kinase
VTSPENEPGRARSLPDLIAGRYRIVSRIGIGGMGVVYKATDTQLNRSVAMKALEERRLHLAGAAARLRAEALAAASLDHPYICKVYELVETPTDTFIVMEFVEGETLSSVMKRGVMPLPQALQFGREIAEGLANAHARGLVHRDVKPGNVMVTPHGHVKLLDFGVAGADVDRPSGDVTRTVDIQPTFHAGTPQYMAPEQAAGQPISARADLFSLGVLLYECLTGQLPFSGTTTFDYVRHVMQSAPRRLDRIAPELPAELVDLVNRCLEKTPADRPASADVVVAELQRLEDLITSPTGSLRTVRQDKVWRRWRTVAISAIAIATIAGAWMVWRPRGDTGEFHGTLRPFVTTSAAESGSRISPDGQWVSFIATAGGDVRILLQRIDGGEARPLTLGSGQPVSHGWSPDGTRIAAVMQLDAGLAVQVFPAFFGGEPIATTPLGGGPSQATVLAWIDRWIYLQIPERGVATLRRIAADGSGAAEVVSANWKLDGNLRFITLKPDASMAVIGVSRNGRDDLWSVNLDGSDLRQLTDDAFFDKYPVWLGSRDRVVFQSNRGGQVDLWELDLRTRAATALTTSETEEVPNSASVDGKTISFQQLTKDANLWDFAAAGGQQLTQDSLSDYSPVLSGDGHTIAFQRSQQTPSRGYTILDAKVFVSAFDRKPVSDPRAVADGFAADLSHDGQWLSYMQAGAVPTRMTLVARDLRGGATVTLSKTAALPSLMLSPVDWATRMAAWTHTGADLFFVDQPDVCVIRRFHAGDAEPGAALVKAPAKDMYFRDLSVSEETGHLAFLAQAKGKVTIEDLDPATGIVRDVAILTGAELGEGVVSRGWFGSQIVALRYLRFNRDSTADFDVLLIANNRIQRVGTIEHGFTATVRVNPSGRELYVTRVLKGLHNVFAFALETGQLTAITQNALPGVTFSGFEPTGAHAWIGVREERRDDIWLIQQTPPTRAGNPAGR